MEIRQGLIETSAGGYPCWKEEKKEIAHFSNSITPNTVLSNQLHELYYN